MKNRKGIMALEGLEAELSIEDGIDTEVVEGEVAELDVLDGEIEETCDQHDEAVAIGDTVDTLADTVEERITSGEGVSEGEAELLEIATEHFSRRLGYAKKIMPALEGFATPEGALTQSKVALENLQKLSNGLHHRLAISQEGIFESMAKSVTMVFETEEKVMTNLRKVSLAYDGKTVKEGQLEDPAWGKYLKTDKAVYSGADGVATLANIEKLASNNEVKDKINELSKCLQGLTKEVKGNWFASNKADIERIVEIQNKATQELDGLTEAISFSTKNKTTQFTPVQPAEKAKLVQAITKMMADKSLTAELKNCFSKSSSLGGWMLWNTQFRLKGMAGGLVGPAGQIIGGMQAEDIKKANATNAQVMKVVKAVKEIISAKVKICSALVSYIEASAS